MDKGKKQTNLGQQKDLFEIPPAESKAVERGMIGVSKTTHTLVARYADAHNVSMSRMIEVLITQHDEKFHTALKNAESKKIEAKDGKA